MRWLARAPSLPLAPAATMQNLMSPSPRLAAHLDHKLELDGINPELPGLAAPPVRWLWRARAQATDRVGESDWRIVHPTAGTTCLPPGGNATSLPAQSGDLK